MDFTSFYPEFMEEIVSILKASKSKRVNGTQKFTEFMINKFEANELDDVLYDGITEEENFNNYSIDELIRNIEDQHNHLIRWFNKNCNQITIKNRVNWILNSTEHSKHIDQDLTQEDLLTTEDKQLLNMGAGTVTESHYASLLAVLQKLESLEGSEKLPEQEAKCALLIAEAKFRNKDEEANAKNWQIAGDKNNACGHIDIARLCFKRAGKLYSQCYMYLEAASNLKLAIDLTDYSKLKNAVERDSYRKLLVDCRLQYERAGQNQEAANLFIKENDIWAKESKLLFRWLMKLFKLVANYGESPLRVFFTACVLTFASVAVYYFCGIWDGEKVITKNFGTSFYFSIVTFTTLGYGDYSPTGGLVRIVATIQAFCGLLLTSLFMVTLVRKFSR